MKQFRVADLSQTGATKLHHCLDMILTTYDEQDRVDWKQKVASALRGKLKHKAGPVLSFRIDHKFTYSGRVTVIKFRVSTDFLWEEVKEFVEESVTA